MSASVWLRWKRALGGGASVVGKAARDDVEAGLISADVGTALARRLCSSLPVGSGASWQVYRQALVSRIADILRPCERPLDFSRPLTIIFAGVNGSGKTTTIGKLARLVGGHNVVIAACDTFRAAACDQLGIWAERVGARLVSAQAGVTGRVDPASIAYRASKIAQDENRLCVFIDTAGRLPTSSGLMAELKRIHNAAHKAAPDRVFHGVVVVDGGSGSNAIAQIEAFGEAMPVTGIVLTKLDGTARGGIGLAIADRFDIAVHYVGLGEGVEDLVAFDASQFARGLVGVDQ